MLTSMELYDKVDKLRIQKGMRVAELNRLAGISHGTLPSWKQRGTMPKLEVLDGICYALDISLAELLFDVDDNKLTGEEIDLIFTWRKASDEQRKAFMAMLKSAIK